MVPIENREGRKLIERTGDFCERKNGHGVDPNRNWEVDWGKREKDYSAYEENAGLHAFSEPEAYILRNLVHEFKPHVWVNVHSGLLCLPISLLVDSWLASCCLALPGSLTISTTAPYSRGGAYLADMHAV